jgi:hypothetical protein
VVSFCGLFLWSLSVVGATCLVQNNKLNILRFRIHFGCKGPKDRELTQILPEFNNFNLFGRSFDWPVF